LLGFRNDPLLHYFSISESVPRSCLCSTVWVSRFPASLAQVREARLFMCAW